MFRAGHGISRVMSQNLSESFNVATRCAPADVFLSVLTEMGSVGSTAPSWAPKGHFMDIGSQQSPGLTKHMLLKLMSSFEILFLHRGDGEYILLRHRSFAIKGLLIVSAFFTEQLSDIDIFCMGSKTSFSPDRIRSPSFARKHYSLRYSKGKSPSDSVFLWSKHPCLQKPQNTRKY